MSDAQEDTAAQEADLTEAQLLGDALDEADAKPAKKSKKAKKEEPPKPEAPQGLVLYTDGGCRPNPGFGGWGLHGYLFRDEAPKKGSGNPDHILTNRGYVTKVDWAKTGSNAQQHEVTPVHYVDGYGSFLGDVTNNIAEIQATTSALNHAKEFVIESVLVITDSEHVIKGLSGWVDNWQRNGWVRADGSPISNVAYWQALIVVRDELRQRGVRVEIDWIKGHADFLGNELADKLATTGVMTSRKRMHRHEITTALAEGYWKYDADKHPMLNHRFMYMNTNAAHNQPGEYYIGNAGNEPELMGKRTSDGAYGLVRLCQPEPVVEMVRTRQIGCAGPIDLLLLVRLENLFRPDIHQRITTYGDVVLVQPKGRTLDLEDLKEEPLVKELSRPGIAWRTVDAVAALSDLLDQYLAGDSGLAVTDLTPILYETSTKTDKKGETSTVCKLKPEFNVGFASLPVKAAYKVGAGLGLADINVTLGIDMLDRNSLKRLEDKCPKVSLITWMEAEDAFRFATIVEAGDDKGIWAGVNSNLRVVKQ